MPAGDIEAGLAGMAEQSAVLLLGVVEPEALGVMKLRSERYSIVT
jgi:hypothetical protein